MDYLVLKDEQEVIENLRINLEKISNEAISENGKFSVGFSGAQNI